jgi:hypothetical protein
MGFRDRGDTVVEVVCGIAPNRRGRGTPPAPHDLLITIFGAGNQADAGTRTPDPIATSYCKCLCIDMVEPNRPPIQAPGATRAPICSGDPRAGLQSGRPHRHGACTLTAPAACSVEIWLSRGSEPARNDLIAKECEAAWSRSGPPTKPSTSQPVEDAFVERVSSMLQIQRPALVDAGWRTSARAGSRCRARAPTVLALEPRYTEFDISAVGSHPERLAGAVRGTRALP